MSVPLARHREERLNRADLRLVRGRGRSMISTGREWLHRVDCRPSSVPWRTARLRRKRSSRRKHCAFQVRPRAVVRTTLAEVDCKIVKARLPAGIDFAYEGPNDSSRAREWLRRAKHFRFIR